MKPNSLFIYVYNYMTIINTLRLLPGRCSGVYELGYKRRQGFWNQGGSMDWPQCLDSLTIAKQASKRMEDGDEALQKAHILTIRCMASCYFTTLATSNIHSRWNERANMHTRTGARHSRLQHGIKFKGHFNPLSRASANPAFVVLLSL